jgi:hypothetical protein
MQLVDLFKALKQARDERARNEEHLVSLLRAITHASYTHYPHVEFELHGLADSIFRQRLINQESCHRYEHGQVRAGVQDAESRRHEIRMRKRLCEMSSATFKELLVAITEDLKASMQAELQELDAAHNKAAERRLDVIRAFERRVDSAEEEEPVRKRVKVE